MQESFKSFIFALRTKRGMFFPEENVDCYTQVVAGIIGFDYATQGGALMGFREWLVLKYNGMSNLAWFAIVDLVASNENITESEAKSAFLLDQIEEYLDARYAQGAARLFHKYGEWEKISKS